MENSLKKIHKKIAQNCTEEKARKIKKGCLIAGSILLVLGLAGFISSFISFLVLFLRLETETAMTLWFIAIPFILFIVIGSVVTRIGDSILIENIKFHNADNGIDNKDDNDINELDKNKVNNSNINNNSDNSKKEENNQKKEKVSDKKKSNKNKENINTNEDKK